MRTLPGLVCVASIVGSHQSDNGLLDDDTMGEGSGFE